jgi:hypothetical protein
MDKVQKHNSFNIIVGYLFKLQYKSKRELNTTLLLSGL